MQEVSVIINNYNGMEYLDSVHSILDKNAFQKYENILPWVKIVERHQNWGFEKLLNPGINEAATPMCSF